MSEDPTGRETRVKVCGVTRLADAELATELGAWAVGMILAYPESPRSCSHAEAQRIGVALHRRVELCGVFVNAPLETVVEASREIGLSLLQLHGDEGPAYCLEAARRTGARVIRATQVADAGDIRELGRYHVDYHLLDARSARRPELRGGTGETFDWSLLRARRSKVPLILSGGIGPENAAAAIAATHPFAIDSASGTEGAPGRKDPQRVAALFNAVREASAAPSPDEPAYATTAGGGVEHPRAPEDTIG